MSILFLLLSSKVKTCIEVYTSKEVIGREITATIIIGMKDSTHTNIPFAIVPHHTKASNTININIIELKIVDRKGTMSNVSLTTFIS